MLYYTDIVSNKIYIKQNKIPEVNINIRNIFDESLFFNSRTRRIISILNIITNIIFNYYYILSGWCFI